MLHHQKGIKVKEEKSIPDIDGEGIRGGDFPALGL